ncbi:MAG TPA: MOSC N-terminal beta barrel domain-containing protein [Solirubrobacteraceae bacterium]|nr:MOSC N-terminal beta barrel domain-containing protein [Solirubrobacteraceae bacterium]
MSDARRHADAEPGAELARVTALSLTPVKGLRIAPVERLVLDRDGARGDRRFYLVEERGWMVNGKHSRALNEVVAELDADEHDGEEHLTLRFPDGSRVSAPVELGETLQTRFFSRPREARLLLGPFAAALSRHAEEELRFVQPVGGTAVDRGRRGAVSMISLGSLGRLAQLAGEPSVDARRFRMSIELDGVEPFAEEDWIERTIAIGETRVRLRGNVGRCIVTSRNPESGEVDLPTLDLLRELRSGVASSEPLPFGVYGEVAQPGIVRLGDRVEVL